MPGLLGEIHEMKRMIERLQAREEFLRNEGRDVIARKVADGIDRLQAALEQMEREQ